MALRTQKFQGTPGTNVTTGNSGGGGSDPYDLVNPTNSAAVTYSDEVANPLYGGTVGKIDGSLASTAEVRWTPANHTAGAHSAVVRFTGYPTTGLGVVDWIYNRGTARNANVRLTESGDGRMRLYRMDSSVSGADVAAVDVPDLFDEWVVVDLVTVIGTTISNGTLKYRLRLLSDLSGTPLASYSATNVDVGTIGTHVLNMYQLGKMTSAPQLPDMYVAQHRVNDGATDYLADPVASSLSISADVQDGTFVDLAASVGATDVTAVTETSAHGVSVVFQGLGIGVSEPGSRLTDIVLSVDVTGPGGAGTTTVTIPPKSLSGNGARVGPLIMVDSVLR